MLFLRPGRIISLAILVAIVGGGWWAWGRVHRSSSPSESEARSAVRAAPRTLVGVPKAGVWRYSSGGHERIGLGPISVGRDLPGRALVVVTALRNGERSVETLLSSDHSEAWHVTPGADGLVGSFREVSIGTIGYRTSISGKTTPSVLLVPKHLRVGQTWKGQYAVTGIVFLRSSKVLRRETVAVGGVPVRTWVIATTETLTGVVHGEDALKEWWSPDLGLAVKISWHRRFQGSVINGVDDTLGLGSLLPLR